MKTRAQFLLLARLRRRDMKSLRALVAIGGLAATLAMGSMANFAQAADAAASADKSIPASSVGAKKPKPAPFPTILVLCRPYQTCPP